MPLDSNGVWQYEETDIVSPFSDFMNLGMSSASTQIANALAEVDAAKPSVPVRSGNTGIVDLGVTMASGWTLGTNFVSASGYNRQIYFNLIPTSTIASTSTGDIGNIVVTDVGLPPSYRPIIGIGCHADINGVTGTKVRIGENGEIVVSALLPDQGWTADTTRSFSAFYMTNVWV